MIRVLLVDDQELVRAGFRTILESADDIEIAGEAGTGREAITRASELNPDVICMDVQMPDMDGLEATRAIVADPTVTSAVLILTTFNRDDYLFAALKAGASGFLLKNSSAEDLIAAVGVVARGDALLSPAVTRSVIEHVGRADGGSTERATPSNPAATAGLTGREREVLGMLARGLSNAEIARRMYVGESTVKTHVSNVLAKLGLRDRIQAVVFAYENGVVGPRGEG